MSALLELAQLVLSWLGFAGARLDSLVSSLLYRVVSSALGRGIVAGLALAWALGFVSSIRRALREGKEDASALGPLWTVAGALVAAPLLLIGLVDSVLALFPGRSLLDRFVLSRIGLLADLVPLPPALAYPLWTCVATFLFVLLVVGAWRVGGGLGTSFWKTVWFVMKGVLWPLFAVLAPVFWAWRQLKALLAWMKSRLAPKKAEAAEPGEDADEKEGDEAGAAQSLADDAAAAEAKVDSDEEGRRRKAAGRAWGAPDLAVLSLFLGGEPRDAIERRVPWVGWSLSRREGADPLVDPLTFRPILRFWRWVPRVLALVAAALGAAWWVAIRTPDPGPLGGDPRSLAPVGPQGIGMLAEPGRPAEWLESPLCGLEDLRADGLLGRAVPPGMADTLLTGVAQATGGAVDLRKAASALPRTPPQPKDPELIRLNAIACKAAGGFSSALSLARGLEGSAGSILERIASVTRRDWQGRRDARGELETMIPVLEAMGRVEDAAVARTNVGYVLESAGKLAAAAAVYRASALTPGANDEASFTRRAAAAANLHRLAARLGNLEEVAQVEAAVAAALPPTSAAGQAVRANLASIRARLGDYDTAVDEARPLVGAAGEAVADRARQLVGVLGLTGLAPDLTVVRAAQRRGAPGPIFGAVFVLALGLTYSLYERWRLKPTAREAEKAKAQTGRKVLGWQKLVERLQGQPYGYQLLPAGDRGAEAARATRAWPGEASLLKRLLADPDGLLGGPRAPFDHQQLVVERAWELTEGETIILSTAERSGRHAAARVAAARVLLDQGRAVLWVVPDGARAVAEASAWHRARFDAPWRYIVEPVVLRDASPGESTKAEDVQSWSVWRDRGRPPFLVVAELAEVHQLLLAPRANPAEQEFSEAFLRSLGLLVVDGLDEVTGIRATHARFVFLRLHAALMRLRGSAAPVVAVAAPFRPGMSGLAQELLGPFAAKKVHSYGLSQDYGPVAATHTFIVMPGAAGGAGTAGEGADLPAIYRLWADVGGAGEGDFPASVTTAVVEGPAGLEAGVPAGATYAFPHRVEGGMRALMRAQNLDMGVRPVAPEAARVTIVPASAATWARVDTQTLHDGTQPTVPGDRVRLVVVQDDPVSRWFARRHAARKDVSFQEPAPEPVVGKDCDTIASHHLECLLAETAQPGLPRAELVRLFVDPGLVDPTLNALRERDELEEVESAGELLFRARPRQLPHLRCPLDAVPGELLEVRCRETTLRKVERARAAALLHPGRVFTHQGERYRVLDDPSQTQREAGIVLVEREESDRVTVPISSCGIKPVDVRSPEAVGFGRKGAAVLVWNGVVGLEETVSGLHVYPAAGGPATTTTFEEPLVDAYQTRAALLLFPPELAGLAGPAVRHAFVHLLRALLPSQVVVDPEDVAVIDIAGLALKGGTWEGIAVVDRIPGSYGYANQFYRWCKDGEPMRKLLGIVREIAAGADGASACALRECHRQNPNEEAELDPKGLVALLDAFLEPAGGQGAPAPEGPPPSGPSATGGAPPARPAPAT